MSKPEQYLEKENQKISKYLASQNAILDENQKKINELKKEIQKNDSTKSHEQLRRQIKTVNKTTKKVKLKFNHQIGVLKTEVSQTEEQISYLENNLKKYERLLNKAKTKFEENDQKTAASKMLLAKKEENKKVKKEIKPIKKEAHQFDRKIKKVNRTITKIDKENYKLSLQANNLFLNIEIFKDDYQELLESKEVNESNLVLQEEFQKLVSKKDEVEQKIRLNHEDIVNNQTLIHELESKKGQELLKNQTTVDYYEALSDAKKQLELNKKLKKEVKIHQKPVGKTNKEKAKKEAILTIQHEKIKAYIPLAGLGIDDIIPQETKFTKTLNSVERLFLEDWFFIIISGLLSAGVVLATSLYINAGVGALNEIVYAQMLNEGMQTGDFSAAIGFAAGFLIARILEAPMTGILDVGGSILSGVGIGIPGVLLSSQKTAWMIESPMFSLLVGLITGLVIGLIIMVVRFFKPKDAQTLGTDIMIGAGNATGKFMGPLVVFSAAMFQPLVGLGAGIGAALFMYWKKPIVGGAIIGSMLFGVIPAFL